jgi:putative tricarboxylic transport membrane protein
MENLWIGIVSLFTDPIAILLFFAALITGLLFAALPGINMVTLGAIILPFAFGVGYLLNLILTTLGVQI